MTFPVSILSIRWIGFRESYLLGLFVAKCINARYRSVLWPSSDIAVSAEMSKVFPCRARAT